MPGHIIFYDNCGNGDKAKKESPPFQDSRTFNTRSPVRSFFTAFEI